MHQPSPYAYVWFDAPKRDFNVEVKVGCKDSNSVDFCEDCKVEDNSRCGPCNAGWTKTNDPHMKCWAVGSMTVDCSNGAVIYHPKGCNEYDPAGYTKDCTCGGVDDISGCGQQISRISRKYSKSTNAVTSTRPTITYRPAKGKPGYIKHYSGDKSWDRKVWGVMADGTLIIDTTSASFIRQDEASGALNMKKVQTIIKAGCGGQSTRVPLNEEDRKTIPTILGESTAAAGPSVTTTSPTPASGLDTSTITTQSSITTPVTSETTQEPTSLGKLVLPIVGVIGLLGFMKYKSGN